MAQNIANYTAGFAINTEGVSEQIQKTSASISDMVGKYLKPIAIGTAIAGGLTYAINKAMDFETIQSQLSTLFQSESIGKNLFKELNAFSTSSHIAVKDLGQMASTLKGFGAADENSMVKTLRMIGDITHGQKDQMKGLALVYGQVAAQGKIMGNDIYQFINNGVPIYDLLSKSMGKSIAELKDMQSQGKITFNDLEKAFQKATAEGGMFYGSIEAASKTLSGQLASLHANIDTLAGTIGMAFLPIVKFFTGVANEILTALIPVAQWFTDVLTPVFEFIVRILSKVWDSLKMIASVIGTILAPIFNQAKENILFFLNILNGVFDVLEVVTELIYGIFKKMSGSIKGVADTLSNYLAPVINFIKDLFNSVWIEILTGIKWIQDVLNKSLEWVGSNKRINWITGDDISSIRDGKKKVIEHKSTQEIKITHTGNIKTDSKHIKDVISNVLNSESDMTAVAVSQRRLELGLTE